MLPLRRDAVHEEADGSVEFRLEAGPRQAQPAQHRAQVQELQLAGQLIGGQIGPRLAGGLGIRDQPVNSACMPLRG